MGADFQLVQLRAFVAVAALNSYSRAAERLSYSEPAVYLQVRNLERILGVELFVRRGRRLELTPVAARLLPQVTEILEQALGLMREAQGFVESPQIHLGTGRHTGPYVVMPLLASYIRENPTVDITVHVLGPHELIAGVIDGSLDLAIAGTLQHYIEPERLRHNELVMVPWLKQRRMLVSPASAEREAQQDLTFALRESVFVAPYQASSLARIEAEVHAILGTSSRVRMLETADAVKSAVVNRLGLAVLPNSAISLELDQGRMVTVSELSELGDQYIMLFHRRPRALKRAVRMFIRFVSDHRRGGFEPLGLGH